MTESTGRVSLRIAEFAVTNFRTFRERTVIPLSIGDQADPLVVFHGDNGAGKSNALAALDLFFRAITHWMGWRAGTKQDSTSGLRCAWDEVHGPQRFVPKRRDWPPGNTAPMLIEVQFADKKSLGRYCVELTPSGSEVFLSARILAEDAKGLYVDFGPTASKTLKNFLETPHGPQSRPLFSLDEHRRGSWRDGDSYKPEAVETLSPLLAEQLLKLRLSLEPIDRQRWKAFGALLSRFPTLQGKEVSVDRVERDSVPELFFEDPGRQILRLTELSSGEQQLVTLCAAILTSRASIVAIAEPEMSLSETNQRMLRSILEEQVQSGLIDQLILESHVYTFDGPEVVRFKRVEGVTRVAREPIVPGAQVLAERAREGGAEEEFVTGEGFTRLPQAMRRELGVEGGGMVWFLKDERKRWAAWKTEELDAIFGLKGEKPEEG